MDFGFIQTGRGVTLFFGAKPVPVDQSHFYYDEILGELKKGYGNFDVPRLQELSNIPEAIKGKLFGDVTVTDGSIYYKNRQVHNALTNKMIQVMKEGWDVSIWANFLNNVMQNPSETAINELYLFLEAAQMPLTPDGHFLAFKKVRNDYTSIHDGKTDNSIGSKPSMPREEVDADRYTHCSRGLHFCAHSYLSSFSSVSEHRVLILKINPADVVAIPSDYNNAKGRAWTYEVVGEIDNPGEGARDKRFDKAVDESWNHSSTEVEEGWDAPEEVDLGLPNDYKEVRYQVPTTIQHVLRPTETEEISVVLDEKELTRVVEILEKDELLFGDIYTAAEILAKVKEIGSVRGAGRALGIAKSTFGDWFKRAKEVIEQETSSDTYVRVVDNLSDLLGVDVYDIDPGSKIIDDIGADSLDLVEIVMALEEEFGIEIPDEDVEKLADITVSDIVKYVDRAITGQ